MSDNHQKGRGGIDIDIVDGKMITPEAVPLTASYMPQGSQEYTESSQSSYQPEV